MQATKIFAIYDMLEETKHEQAKEEGSTEYATETPKTIKESMGSCKPSGKFACETPP